jgi:hypothetical protein
MGSLDIGVDYERDRLEFSDQLAGCLLCLRNTEIIDKPWTLTR